MSESESHKRLVKTTARKILELYPSMEILVDFQEMPGSPIPPLIGGHRPDIFAQQTPKDGDIIIAEAKTPKDVDNAHTLSQVEAFVGFLKTRRRGVGTLVLTVQGFAACRAARNFLHYNLREFVSPQLRVQLFDGLDFWSLGGPEEAVWRLS